MQNVLVDVLGRPIFKGSTVLTNSPGSSYLDTLAIVEKVNKKSAAVTLNATRWDHAAKDIITTLVRKLKPSYLLVVVDAQLDYNAEHYPEYMI